MEPLRSWACSAVRRAEGQAPRERRKTSRGRTVLLALDAELNCKRNCPWSTERESRLKGRNFDMIVFLADVRVKVNRRTLLCKTIGRDGRRRRTEVRSGRGARATNRRKKDLTQRSQRHGGHEGRKNAGLKTGHYGARAAGTPRSAMLSPFLREGTALTWRTTAETGARGSAMSLPV